MTFCYILAILFLAVGVLIILLAYNHSRRNRAADDNMKVKFLGMEINAKGFMGLALVTALAFGFLSFSFGGRCIAVNAMAEWQGQVDEAKRAFDQASMAEAHKYAEGEMARATTAQEALKRGVEEAESAHGPSAASQVKDLANEARRAAEAAREAALAGRERMKESASGGIETASAALAAAAELQGELETCKRQPKGFAADLAMLKAMIDGLTSELENTRTAFASEDFAGAQAGAENVLDQSRSLLADIRSAMEKIKCVEE